MRCTTECLQFEYLGQGGKKIRRTGEAKKFAKGGNKRCNTERRQFEYLGSGGKINRCAGETKKFKGEII
jgi:hypothetical protein